MSSESDQVIEALTAQFRTLVKQNWIEIWAYLNGAAKGSFGFSIAAQGRAYTLKSNLSYGVRLKHKVKEDFTPAAVESPNPRPRLR